MEQEVDDDELKECYSSYEKGNRYCEECTDKTNCMEHTELPKGKLYSDVPEKRDELEKHMMEIQHPFHDVPEMFEVYECPNCHAHFFVESEAIDSLTNICCPYCKTEFVAEFVEDEKAEENVDVQTK